MLIRNTTTNRPIVYALIALICLHSASIDAKTNADDELIDLKTQDRSLWYFSLIKMGDTAIAAEHLKAKTIENTHWDAILKNYKNPYHFQPMLIHLLHMPVVQLQLKDLSACAKLLSQLHPKDLEQGAYLYHGTITEYYLAIQDFEKANESIDTPFVCSLISKGKSI